MSDPFSPLEDTFSSLADSPVSLDTQWLTLRRDGPPHVVLGTMNFGKRTPSSAAERILARALERGICFFDTANLYADGESERIVGRAIATRRDRVLVATKVGLDRVGGHPEGLSRAAILRAIDGSLSRLGTDYVDVYYLHAPDYDSPLERTIDAVAELLDKKKIRYFGVSNYASWQILEIMTLCDERGIKRPALSQVMYNLLIRQIEIEYMRFAQRHSLHTTVYNPLAGGLLSGRYQQGDGMEPGSRFDKNKLYQRRYWNERLFEAMESYRALAAKYDQSLVEFAYGFLASSPGVDSILVGPATMEQLDAAIEACRKPLSGQAYREAKILYETWSGTDATYAR